MAVSSVYAVRARARTTPSTSVETRVPAVPASIASMSVSAPIDGGLAGRAGEVAGGDHLREHRAGGELVAMLGEERVGVRAHDRALLGRAEADERRRRVGRHDEDVGVDVAREQAAGVVLVDHGLDADELPSGPVGGRDAAAAGADDDAALLEQPADRSVLEDALRCRRRHDAAHAVAVGLEGPAAVGRELVGLVGGVQRPDRLGRVGERRIVGVDLDHREQRRERLLERQPVAELLLDRGSRSSPASRRRARRAASRARPRRRLPRAPADRSAGRCRARSRARAAPRSARDDRTPRRRSSRWFSTVIGSPRRSSALPPSATTTLIGSASCGDRRAPARRTHRVLGPPTRGPSAEDTSPVGSYLRPHVPHACTGRQDHRLDSARLDRDDGPSRVERCHRVHDPGADHRHHGGEPVRVLGAAWMTWRWIDHRALQTARFARGLAQRGRMTEPEPGPSYR